MAHVEMQLISRIIRSGKLAAVIEWGITEDDFLTTEGHGMFTHLKGYHLASETRGSVAGPYAMASHYKNFDLCDDDSMTLEALCVEVRKNRVRKSLEASIFKATETLNIDPMQAAASLAAEITAINALGTRSRDTTLSSAIADQKNRYFLMKTGVGVSKLLWPWEPLNKATAGIQSDDYVVFYGRPKSMKSFVISAIMAFLYNLGLHVLVYTKEMPDWQLFRRTVAFIAGLPYDELRLGGLSPDDEAAFLAACDMIELQAKNSGGKHNVTCISGQDAPAGTDNMTWLRSKVEKYKPDIVFIDGLYLMAPESKVMKDDQRVMQVSRACRQMVLATGIPAIVTVQANRKAAGHERAEFDEIAYSDAIGQDATAVIRVINEKTGPTVALVMGGAREYKLHGIRIGGVPCTDFTFKEEMSEKDIQKAQEKDVGEEPEQLKSLIREPSNKGEKKFKPPSQKKMLEKQLKNL